VKAVLAAEDDRFFEHPGIDYQSCTGGGAAGQDRRAPSGRQHHHHAGGAELLLSPEKTFVRKLTEILLALRIESELSKNEILELYLNKNLPRPPRLRRRRGRADLLRQERSGPRLAESP